MAETTGNLTHLTLKTCATKACYEVTAPRGEQGANPNLISLEHPSLKILGKSPASLSIGQSPIFASEGYYDAMTSLVVLRGIQQKGYRELVLDLTSGEVETY